MMEGIGGVATALALVVALVFGILQWRADSERRRRELALTVISAIQTREAFEATRLLCTLPKDARAEDVERAGPDMVRAANELQMICETLGYAVYSGALPLRTVDEMGGGAIRAAWSRLRAWAERTREREGSPNAFEWMQWLAERLDENPVAWKAEGAHVALRDWRP